MEEHNWDQFLLPFQTSFEEYFVRGYLKAHDQENNLVLDADYGAAFGASKGHYGADNLMLKDINQHLTNLEKITI